MTVFVLTVLAFNFLDSDSNTLLDSGKQLFVRKCDIMYVLKVPEDTETIELLGEKYQFKLDFHLLDEMKRSDSLADGFTPTDAQLPFHIQQLQELFVSLFGVEISLAKTTPEKEYVKLRMIAVQIYKLLHKRQQEYLWLEYGLNQELLTQQREMLAKLEVLKDFKKDGEKQSNQ